MQTYLYTCQQIVLIAPDISKIILVPVDQSIPYSAGQYVEAELPNQVWLPLSIANKPHADGSLEFHLRHNAQNPLAQVLMQQLSMQPQLTLRGPFGNFIPARGQGNKWLFLAGGTGFAPIKAVLSEILRQPEVRPCHLFWGVKRPEDCYERELLAHWQQTIPQFEYTIVLSEPASYPLWQEATGLVHDYLAQSIDNLVDSCIFACGPYAMIKAAYSLFLTKGLDQQGFISDMAYLPLPR